MKKIMVSVLLLAAVGCGQPCPEDPLVAVQYFKEVYIRDWRDPTPDGFPWIECVSDIEGDPEINGATVAPDHILV